MWKLSPANFNTVGHQVIAKVSLHCVGHLRFMKASCTNVAPLSNWKYLSIKTHKTQLRKLGYSVNKMRRKKSSLIQIKCTQMQIRKYRSINTQIRKPDAQSSRWKEERVGSDSWRGPSSAERCKNQIYSGNSSFTHKSKSIAWKSFVFMKIFYIYVSTTLFSFSFLFFIGPKSDHSLPMSVTNSLTNWRPCWRLNELT